MESLKLLGIPVMPILVVGFLVWATTQIFKNAEKTQKMQYLLYSFIGAVAASAQVTFGLGPWDWKKFSWMVWGGWIAANLGHKLFARYLRKFITKEPTGV